MSISSWLNNRIRSVCGGMIRLRSVKVQGTVRFTESQAQYIEFGPYPVWDSDSFWDSDDPTAIKIPEGLGGRYLVHSTLKWMNGIGARFTEAQRDGGYFAARFDRTREGTTLSMGESDTTVAPIHRASEIIHRIVWETDLEAGDILQLHAVPIFQDFSVHTEGLTLDTWVCARRLGDSD